MAVKVKSTNPPTKTPPPVPAPPVLPLDPAPAPLCYGELQQRLDACQISEKSPIRVRMTMLEPLFGLRRDVFFSVRSVIYTPGPKGKPDLVELFVQ